MGSVSSRRRRRNMEMNDVDANDAGEGRRNDTDLPAILSYLIRSGQVRILNPSMGFQNDDDDEDEEVDIFNEDEFLGHNQPPRVEPNPDTTCIDQSELKQQVLLNSGQMDNSYGKQRHNIKPVCRFLQLREVGLGRTQCFSKGECCLVTSKFLPNHMENKVKYHSKAFCGTYSQDGNIFLSACQDRFIRIYDTANGKFKLLKVIQARDVGWSVLDTAFSPDGRDLVYSSWSECMHICSIYGDDDTHNSLHLFPGTDHSFCVFSLCFSQDNNEILGGANDGCIYVYDREKNERILKIDSHEDDVNAVAFADESSHILFSGADDGLCKVWDRRTLSEDHPLPVGTWAGHSDGITFIHSKEDGRYLISNSKDQTIKLWDMRRFSTKDAIDETKRAVERQKWDYRWQQVPSRVRQPKYIAGDSSLMTYRGHCVLNTLVRCRFSPMYNTGQRYIYSGCATGAVVVYDVLTGAVVSRLRGQNACVRDVSWHPYDNKILSTSWDGSIAEWSYREQEEEEATHISSESTSDSDSDDEASNGHLRRSSRLKELHRRIRERTSGSILDGLL